MFLIAGLGNPEEDYSNTRHNMGFDTINKLAKQYKIEVNKNKFKGLYGIGNIENQKVVLLKPQTFMNLSGESIKEAIDFYKIQKENIIIIYDDMDVSVGSIKIRKKGGPGTHNGAKSVVHELVSEDFPRIRVGIGKPADEYDAIDYVIGKLDEEKYKALEAGINRAADATIYYIEYGIDNAMNRLN